MIKICLKVLLLVPVACFINSCSQKEGLILEEEFDSNRLGWVEERTAFHYLDITDGKYRIRSADINSIRSSANSIAKEYLYNLPDKYEITTSIEIVEGEKEEMHCGILLISSSLEYNFAIYSNGWVVVSEYDYNQDSVTTLFSKHLKVNPLKKAELSLNIDQMEFALEVNGASTGSGSFKHEANSWRDLRLYTCSESAILIDFLKIR